MKIAIEQILTQLLGFLILVWLLKRLAWKPLLALLDERKARISNQLDEIHREKEEAERLRKDYERRIAEIDARAQRKIQEAIEKGQKIAGEIREKAKEEAVQMFKKAQEEAEKEKEKVMVELRGQMADLVTAVASKVIGRSLTNEDHFRLIDKFVSEVKDFYAKK